MSSGDIQRTIVTVGQTLSKNSPTILTGLAVGGLTTSVIMAITATYKAVGKLEKEYGPEWASENDKKTVIKTVWTCYIPTALMSSATVACIIGAHSVNSRRNAALASAYGLAETALREYQAKVVETIGRNKEQKVHDDIAQDHLNRNPVVSNTVIVTGKGDTLCFDTISGRYFKNDLENIRRCQNDLNAEMLRDGMITLNDLYYALGMEGVELGKDIGWDVEYAQLDISFSAKLTPDGNPCIVLAYRVGPRSVA